MTENETIPKDNSGISVPPRNWVVSVSEITEKQERPKIGIGRTADFILKDEEEGFLNGLPCLVNELHRNFHSRLTRKEKVYIPAPFWHEFEGTEEDFLNLSQVRASLEVNLSNKNLKSGRSLKRRHLDVSIMDSSFRVKLTSSKESNTQYSHHNNGTDTRREKRTTTSDEYSTPLSRKDSVELLLRNHFPRKFSLDNAAREIEKEFSSIHIEAKEEWHAQNQEEDLRHLTSALEILQALLIQRKDSTRSFEGQGRITYEFNFPSRQPLDKNYGQEVELFFQQYPGLWYGNRVGCWALSFNHDLKIIRSDCVIISDKLDTEEAKLMGLIDKLEEKFRFNQTNKSGRQYIEKLGVVSPSYIDR